jgi:hypothetical protein
LNHASNLLFGGLEGSDAPVFVSFEFSEQGLQFACKQLRCKVAAQTSFNETTQIGQINAPVWTLKAETSDV